MDIEVQVYLGVCYFLVYKALVDQVYKVQVWQEIGANKAMDQQAC